MRVRGNSAEKELAEIGVDEEKQELLETQPVGTNMRTVCHWQWWKYWGRTAI